MVAEQAKVREVGPIGMFGTLEITKTVDTKNDTRKITIGNIGADLTYTYRYFDDNKNKYDYIVVPFSKMESNYLNNYKEVYNKFSNILTTFDKNINISKLPDDNN